MIKTIDVKVEICPGIKNESDSEIISLTPEYAHYGDAGFDLRANIPESITLQPLERHLFPTGLRIELPEGYEIQIRPRSGLALNEGISIVNTPGTIDSKFRGEIGVILINLGNEPVTIIPGQRIAQGVIKEYIKGNFIVVDHISRDTNRGDGAYGSSGKF